MEIGGADLWGKWDEKELRREVEGDSAASLSTEKITGLGVRTMIHYCQPGIGFFGSCPMEQLFSRGFYMICIKERTGPPTLVNHKAS
ncbi:hypothetical protein V6N13_021793 [Hibiscus sabdariffa]